MLMEVLVLTKCSFQAFCKLEKLVITNSQIDTANMFGYIDMELYELANQLAPLYPLHYILTVMML